MPADQPNAILFANKRTKQINLQHPISALLDDLLKDVNSHQNEIDSTFVKFDKLLSSDKEVPDEFKDASTDDSSSEIEDDFKIDDQATAEFNDPEATVSAVPESESETSVYFKLDKRFLLGVQRRQKRFSFRRFVIGLLLGYFGQTIKSKGREKSHAASRRYYVTIKVPVTYPNRDSVKFIEYVIIKMLNIRNFQSNQLNGTNFFVQGFEPIEHLYVGLHYLKVGYKLANIYLDSTDLSKEPDDENFDINTQSIKSSQASGPQSQNSTRQVNDSSQVLSEEPARKRKKIETISIESSQSDN